VNLHKPTTAPMKMCMTDDQERKVAYRANSQTTTLKTQAERWLRENTEALSSSSEYVDGLGLPLKSMRQF
jgi:hypothetical protein